ncbi:MAG: hypothetical protein KKD44_03985 [Proteobacteria bacterium]|nr:hypothetical protein [Pseudomonadota bacterium]
MTRKILLCVIILVCCVNSVDSELYNKNAISLLINFEQKQLVVPLKGLSHKTIRPPLTSDSEFIVEDGIYCNVDGNYLEGLCRFKDRTGENWELKFSSEKLSNKTYSIISVTTIRGNEVLQQNDFSFRGRPVDILNSDVAPFSIIGLKTKDSEWFSLTLNTK